MGFENELVTGFEACGVCAWKVTGTIFSICCSTRVEDGRRLRRVLVPQKELSSGVGGMLP